LNGIWVQAIPDSRWVNSDHIPIYRETPSNYSWGLKVTGIQQVLIGGAEKDRFTLQLTYAKDGTKFQLYIIFKGASPKEGITQRRGTVAYEIQHRLPDNNGIEYPPVENCILACAPKGNSNGELTIDILKKVIFPGIGIFEGKRGGVLVDDFKGHSRDIVKEYTLSFKDQTYAYNLCEFQIMAGGITPKSQPVDAITGKIFKGYYREEYELYMLKAPLNEKGQPDPPSRQLCAQWCAAAWNKIPEALLCKTWHMCGYKRVSDLAKEGSVHNSIVQFYSTDQIRSVVEKALGPRASMNYMMVDNEFDTDSEDDLV
jgi:hypothetical protein